MAYVWHVWIDWNNDGVYEADEASRLIAIPRIERGKSSAHDDPMVGVLELQLSNPDRRYDAWYSGSIVYPSLPINRRIKITVEIDSTTYPLFVGRIIEPRSSGFRASGAQGGIRKTTLTANDGWKNLQTRMVDVALSQNTTQRDAISTLLNAVGWIESANLWVLGTGQLDSTTVLGGLYGDNVDLGSDNGDAIPYWWCFNDEPPSSNLLDLVRAHLGRIHIAADGKLVLRTVAADNGTAVDFTLTDSVLQEMNIAYRLDDVRNKITVQAVPRLLSASGVIWTFTEQPQLQAGESRTLWAEFSNAAGEHVPALNVVTPIATTDWTANTNIDGSGTDVTSSITVTMTAYSTNAQIVVTNTAGTPAYLTLLQLRGQLVDSLETSAVIEQDIVSKEAYGAQELNLNLRWQQKTLIAQDLARFALAAYKDPKPAIELRFQNNSVGLMYDLGSKILDNTTQGTGQKYRIGKIMHEVPEGNACQQLFTTWTLFPILPDDAWILGTHTLGETTKLGF